MRRLVFVLLVSATGYLCGVGAAQAEGRCPPGQYPVGGQGMLGCAPIPGYGSGNAVQNDDDDGYQRPHGKWKVTWGAIAWSPENDIVGAALDQYFSKRKAEAGALKVCADAGGKDCVVKLTFKDQCAAFARSDTNLSFAHAPELERALARAMTACTRTTEEAGADGICKVTWSGCAARVYVPR